MKTTIAFLFGCFITVIGAFADSGEGQKKHETASQNEPKSFCVEVKQAIIGIGQRFDKLDKTFFFNEHFEHNTDFHKSGIYLFRNHRGTEERKAKEKRA